MIIQNGVIQIKKIKCRKSFYCYTCHRTLSNFRYEWRIANSFYGENINNGYNFDATNWSRQCLRCLSQKALMLQAEVKNMKEILSS